MDMLLIGVALGFAVAGLFFVALLFARAGSWSRAWWGLTVAGRAQQDPALQSRIDALMGSASHSSPPVATAAKPAVISPPPSAVPGKPSGEALRLLALLQTEARLVDFLMEDVGGATDSQLGLGVREIHKKSAQTLKKHLVLESIITGKVGERTTVAKGFDPSAIRVLGNVTGEPPYTGELQHEGWRVKAVSLPAIPDGQDPFVLQPAEVEMV